EGILFHHRTAKEADPYVIFSIFAFDRRERLDAFLGALQAVIDRHDILRTSMAWEGLAEPVQVVWRKAAVPVDELVLDPAAGDVARQLHERFDRRRYRLDVRHAPLLRVSITYDATNDRWLFVLLLHHLIDDNTSLRHVFEEVQAHLVGRIDQLPPPQPYRNFVAQARLGISKEEHEAFFRKMLGDVDEPTAPFGLTDM